MFVGIRNENSNNLFWHLIITEIYSISTATFIKTDILTIYFAYELVFDVLGTL